MTRRAYHECDGPGCGRAVETHFDTTLRLAAELPNGWFFTFPEPMAEARAFCSPECVARYAAEVTP